MWCGVVCGVWCVVWCVVCGVWCGVWLLWVLLVAGVTWTSTVPPETGGMSDCAGGLEPTANGSIKPPRTLRSGLPNSLWYDTFMR